MGNAWILIPLAAIIGGLFLKYKRQKMEIKETDQQNGKEVEELRKYTDKLKGRIENLEAIAAGAPDEFKAGAGRGSKEIEIDETERKKENRQEASKLTNDLKAE